MLVYVKKQLRGSNDIGDDYAQITGENYQSHVLTSQRRTPKIGRNDREMIGVNATVGKNTRSAVWANNKTGYTTMLSLNDADREEFLYLQKHLILFTNKQFSIYDKFKTIDDLSSMEQEEIQEGIVPIREKMYAAKNIDAFCKKNVELSDEQIAVVKSWRFVYYDDFFIVKHLKNETVLLTKKENKLYGVIGISSGLDDFFPDAALPILIKTKLLPFKDKIVYDGFFGFLNVYLGRNIKGDLVRKYNEIKGLQGIISKPEPNTFLSDISVSKDDVDLVKYYVKKSLKEELFPEKGWQLAKKSNRFAFEQEYAKYFARYEKSSRRSHKEIKPMQYAMYRSCVVGVAETKKILLDFCRKHYSEIAEYLYIFKA